MEKRYQVFVSSTYEDLREERQEVMQALLELDCIPSGMELFPAANEDQWTLIKGVIDDCDYYIVIIGGRYGSKGPDGISYTQMEYGYAVKTGKPVIAFLHKDPGELPANKCEKESEGQEKLEHFRKLVQEKMCKFWTTPADLGSVVSRSIVKLIKNHPAVGWVRADLLPDQNMSEELLHCRKRIEELENSLITSPHGAEQLSQGNDSIEFDYEYRIYDEEDTSYEFRTVIETHDTTWNSIFSYISPFLIDEISDSSLKLVLNKFIENQVKFHLSTEPEYHNCSIKGISIRPDDFNTIKIQLLALGLISKSDNKKNRSVRDKEIYWMLTPYGEAAMMSLRAIRRYGF